MITLALTLSGDRDARDCIYAQPELVARVAVDTRCS